MVCSARATIDSRTPHTAAPLIPPHPAYDMDPPKPTRCSVSLVMGVGKPIPVPTLSASDPGFKEVVRGPTISG